MIKLKICGIRSIEEINELKNLEISYFGCIFVEKSSRFVVDDIASQIIKVAHSSNKKVVGVFLNEEIENIIEKVKKIDLDCIQLHGNENLDYCKKLFFELKKHNEKIKIWKVFNVVDSLPNFTEYLEYTEYILFDTKGINAGGNGIVFDWSILKNLKENTFIIAGGLSKENIEEAIRYKPAVLDINSKVEINNRKSKKLIEEIIERMKIYE